MNKLNKKPTATGFEIAVIGMAGKFPGAANIDEFWQNLKNGVESLSFLSNEQLEEAGVDSAAINDPEYVKTKGGVLENKEYFDAAFFDYTPLEAEVMEPQTRVFHECVWEALEDAGYAPYSYKGPIGLYAGATFNKDWLGRSLFCENIKQLGPFAVGLLADRDYLCTRLAYRLNLKGPAVVMQTACSTSLTAVHMANRALLTGECKIALAGGVTVSSEEKRGYFFQEGMIMSPDGHCRAFDAAAAGTASGDGVGVVVLKRLKAAVADGDHIYAVLLGSAVNNDGMDKVGFTAPGVIGQSSVIKAALHITRVEPESITYVETHGTGTPLGDPIEIEALTRAFKTEKKGYCAIGSVKTNVGHLGSAAGVTGLIKTVLALKHRFIPPSLNFEKPNPKIDFDNTPFYVNRRLKEWENTSAPLRAAVNSFGIGGTNAHVILQEPPKPSVSSTSRPWQLLVSSAKTPTALDKTSENLAACLQENPDIKIPDLAYTLQLGREAFTYRKMMVCQNPGKAGMDEAIEAFTSSESRKSFAHFCKKDNPFVVFMFPGLGAQYEGMGLGLYRGEKVFRQGMNRCFDILSTLIDYDLKEILYPGEPREPVDGDQPEQSLPEAGNKPIESFETSQLAVFIFQYALAGLLMEWGIKPQAMIGYSFGEYITACLSGVFSLEDALSLVVSRGKAVAKVSGGAMLSVPLKREELIPRMESALCLAIDNGSTCVLSGPEEAVDTFEKKMKQERVICMRVQGSYALHSTMMEPIITEFEESVARVKREEPRIPYLSNVTGNWIKVEEATSPGFWSRHLTNTVEFAAGIGQLVKEKNAVFVEIGPGHDLSLLLRRHIEESEPGGEDGPTAYRVLNMVRPAQRKVPDLKYLLTGVGRLWLLGLNPDWKAFYAEEKRHRLPLPTYPFERKRYWLDVDPFGAGGKKVLQSISQGMETDMSDWFYIPTWIRSLAVDIDTEKAGTGSSNWLIFIGRDSWGSQLSERLTRSGEKVIAVREGETFKKIREWEYEINPREKKDYEQLLKEVNQTGRIPDNIAHLFSVTAEEPNSEKGDAIDRHLGLGFYSLLYLIQATENTGWDKRMQLIAVTSEMQQVTGEHNNSPGKSVLLGLLKVIPQEYPNIHCRSVDFTSPVKLPEPGKAVVKEFLNQLLSEFSGHTTDAEVAYRGPYRWVRIYQSSRLEAGNTYRKLKKKGVYMITGGLGNIGLIVAQYLAKELKARLLLTGHSYFPVRDEWSGWLEKHGDDDPVSKKIKQVRRLEELGAEVMVVSVDTADQEGMSEAVNIAVKGFGPINGVVHCAGIVGGKTFATISDLTEEQCREQFRAKINGLLVLEKIFTDRKPGFCLLMSSISTVLGGLKFAAYSAANAFMDAFADRYTSLDSRQWISVAWDGMEPEKTREALSRILSLNGKTSRVVVSTGGNLETRIKRWVNLEGVQEEENPQKKERTDFRPRPYISTSYVPPRNELEKTIADTWQQFFGIDEIGVHDDFFELGGDSLKAITIITRIHKDLNVRIPVSEVFKNLSISALTKYIEKTSATPGTHEPADTTPDRFISIQPAEKKEYYRLSTAQKRMYLTQQLDPDSIAYNITQGFPLEEKIDKEKIGNAFKELIKRHESLRTSIELIGDLPFQFIWDEAEFKVVYFEAAQGEVTGIINGFVQPFDLSKAPFFRVGIIHYGENNNFLIMDIHHIISDGVTAGILQKDFLAVYERRELPELKLQYKDYAQWENSKYYGALLKKQEGYWLKEYEGILPVLNLPTDFPRPEVLTFEGDSVCFKIAKKETEILKQIANLHGATLFIILFAIYYIVLSKISGDEDFIIGVPTMGRIHAELDNIVGVFVNAMAIRNRLAEAENFTQFLNRVKEKTMEAFDNQEYPFETLVKKVVRLKDPKRNPLFDVMFSFQNFRPPTVEFVEEGGHQQGEGFIYENPMTKFELTLIGVEVGGGLEFVLQYSAKLFKKETIQRFTGYFIEIMETVTKKVNSSEKRDIKLKEIKISHDLIERKLDVIKDDDGDFVF